MPSMASSSWRRRGKATLHVYGSLLLLVVFVAGTLASSPPGQASRQAPMQANSSHSVASASTLSSPTLFGDEPPEGCPPCFNCLLPAFSCANSGDCRKFDGQCDCQAGWGGPDCLSPLCGSPVKGKDRYPRKGDECTCDDGWGGLNCNVCQADYACSDFLLGGERLGENGTCYTGGSTVMQSFQQCDVTNRKITEMLPGRPPKVTFSCEKDDEACNFQFWIGQRESFYCDLTGCKEDLERTAESNTTRYACSKAECSCIPGRMLCGEAGSIDIGDFLSEEIKGPATMSCKTGSKGSRDCKFEEPAMNDLISSIFGDSSITLNCNSGECIHYSQEPGYQAPLPPPPAAIFWVVFSAAGALGLVLMVAIMLWVLGRHAKHEEYGSVRLPEDEAARLMADHVPVSLSFRNLSYKINGKAALSGITGSVKPAEVMAIVGSSGAGKTTFLDLLARREKRGTVAGTTLVNGRPLSDAAFNRLTGYVDQEDCLMSTLTVYETVLYSALLRLPREMSIDAKRYRTLETLQELGILGIKDSRIGDSGERSISGGEKRRVSIACELVTSPSILFLDEPTSGLDSSNALNVVECLVNLAQVYRRTVVLSLHQPSSKIVSLLDKLVLLSAGHVVYAGEMDRCATYFEEIAHPCPAGHNILEYLIDLTSTANKSATATASATPSLPPSRQGFADEEAGPTNRNSFADATELQDRQPATTGDSTPAGSIGRSANRLAASVKSAFSTGNGSGIQILPPAALMQLVEAYSTSVIAKAVDTDINAQIQSAADNGTSNIEEADKVLRNYRKASLWTQLRILSGRSFKNLYRNPQLMFAHYVLAFLLGLFVGALFKDLSLDIAGFQDRLGLFFFSLSLFGFSTLTSLGVFASERQLFVRERANGYYSPVTYFFAKLLFDTVPLRVVPPLLFGPLVYFEVGLVPTVEAFWKFILTLVLFSLASSSIVFFLSISIRNTSVANLIGTLTMLLSLLFGGLLLNSKNIPKSMTWLLYASPFHAAYESLLVNELRTLSLTEHKYGIDINVPAATLLSSFGFDSQAYWRDDIILAGVFGGLTIVSLGWLIVYVRERR